MSAATIVGSGPNGLSAAIILAEAGFEVEVREAQSTYGGGARSGELTLPGFLHDLGSAVYPLGVSSPFFSSLPLDKHGLRWIQPPVPLAHPFDDGGAVLVERDLSATARQFGSDRQAYFDLFDPLVRHWQPLVAELLRPVIHLPRRPFLFAAFGLDAIQPAHSFITRKFREARAQTVLAGLAAHSILPLKYPLTTAFPLMFGAAAHAAGWPIAAGGAQSISNALAGVLTSLGGRILTNSPVDSLDALPTRDLILCDVTPRQFLSLAGDRLTDSYRDSLKGYRYGPGAYKVDWALSQPIPWRAVECARAGTVHLGGSLEEITASESAAWRGEHVDKPFVLLSQPSLFDPSRAPQGKHTAWAYCHVPNGSTVSMLSRIESQIERFAPGFRDCVLARKVYAPADLEAVNANLVGGDVNGGAFTIKQFVARPTLRRYSTPLPRVYLCSSSTPPGGAVHGMCGYFAALAALHHRDRRPV
ncbi:MAG TPA: NAD(P)/FAD-dependent oxidoreductase [Bryobacteraceae bacterium]|nr:NAD(P)/FAD-dependent oxidoreductase [Bryobacteraceae bacterium]